MKFVGCVLGQSEIRWQLRDDVGEDGVGFHLNTFDVQIYFAALDYRLCPLSDRKKCSDRYTVTDVNVHCVVFRERRKFIWVEAGLTRIFSAEDVEAFVDDLLIEFCEFVSVSDHVFPRATLNTRIKEEFTNYSAGDSESDSCSPFLRNETRFIAFKEHEHPDELSVFEHRPPST